MPKYTCKCKDCKEKFSVNATLEEKESSECPKFDCPKCGSKNTSQVSMLKTLFSKDKGGDEGCCGGGGCCCGK